MSFGGAFGVCPAAGMAMMWRDRDGEARLLEWYGAARLHGGGGGSLACGDAGGVCRRGCGGVAVLPGGGRALRDGGAGGPARHAVGGGAGGGPGGGCARQGMPGGPPERGGADPHAAAGNCFRTEAEVLRYLPQLMEQLKARYRAERGLAAPEEAGPADELSLFDEPPCD